MASCQGPALARQPWPGAVQPGSGLQNDGGPCRHLALHGSPKLGHPSSRCRVPDHRAAREGDAIVGGAGGWSPSKDDTARSVQGASPGSAPPLRDT